MIHTKTGQLVVFDAPGGHPRRPRCARMVKALRPVTQAGIDRLPPSCSGIRQPTG